MNCEVWLGQLSLNLLFLKMCVKLQTEIQFDFDSIIQQFKYEFECVTKVLGKTLSLN